MDKPKHGDVYIYHRHFVYYIREHLMAVTLLLIIGIIFGFVAYMTELLRFTMSIGIIASAYFIVLIIILILEVEGNRIELSSEDMKVFAGARCYSSRWSNLYSLDVINIKGKLVVGIRSIELITVKKNKRLGTALVNWNSKAVDDDSFLALSPIINIPIHPDLLSGGGRMIDFAKFAKSDFGRKLFHYAPHLLQDAQLQIANQRANAPIKRYDSNPDSVITFSTLMLVVSIAIGVVLFFALVVANFTIPMPIMVLMFAMGVPISIVMIIAIPTNPQSLSIFKDGLGIRINNDSAFYKWEDLSHFEIRGIYRSSITGIAFKKGKSLGNEDSVLSWVYNNIIPLNFLNVHLRYNGVSGPKEVDVDKFAESALGRDLLHYAPQLFELHPNQEMTYKQAFPTVFLYSMFIFTLVWASFSSYWWLIFDGGWGGVFFSCFLIIFFILSGAFVQALDWISTQTMHVYPDGLEITQGRECSFAKWEELEEFELETLGIFMILWIRCNNLSQWRSENPLLMPFRRNTMRIPLIGIKPPIRYNGCLGPEELDIEKFGRTRFGRRLMHYAPHLFEYGKEKAKNG